MARAKHLHCMPGLAARRRDAATVQRVGGSVRREVRELIRRMNFENSLWGATKSHGELLKLGIAVAQSTLEAGRKT
jgi:hypothetical protein